MIEHRAILDARGDVVTEVAYESEGNDMLLHSTQSQNIKPTLDLVKHLQENQQYDSFATKSSDWKRVAEIPIVLYNDLVRRGITKDRKKFRAWLNDYQNRPFRVWNGRV